MVFNTMDIFDNPIYAPAKSIAEHLLKHKRILISCHMNPDADAIGSMFALAYGLKSLGKTVALCNSSNVPDYVAWLPLPSTVHKSLNTIRFKPDLAVVLDCGDEKRLGCIANEVTALPCINIDHHISNPHFGDIDNWVNTDMAATGQMVAAILAALNVPLKNQIGEAIYAAISSDTGSFSYGNTSEPILLLAAHLVKEGLNIAEVRQRMDNSWTLDRMYLWGSLISKIRIERNGSIALVNVSLKQLSKFNARAEDLEGLVEYIRRLRGIMAVALIREDNPKQCKASLRSTGDINVQEMVSPLGGGGHRNAAGALLKNNLAKSSDIILTAMTKWLDENTK